MKADVIVGKLMSSVCLIMWRDYKFHPWKIIMLKIKIIKNWMLIILRLERINTCLLIMGKIKLVGFGYHQYLI